LTDPADKPVSPGTPTLVKAVAPERALARHRSPYLQQPEIWIVPVVLVVVVLAGGGTPIWARALVLMVCGAWIVVRPPRETPSRWFEVALIGLGVAGLVASFAPLTWLGYVPWRSDLAGYGVTLPAVNATAPWLAAEAVAQLVAGVAWLYACWNIRLTHESRKLALWTLAALGCVLSAGAALGNLFKEKYPLGLEAMNFSYFPNRNESALWYCLSGIVAFGLLIEGLHRRRPRFMLAGVMLVPCVLALVMGRSRMAMALFALGTLAVLLVRLGRKSGKYIMGVLVPLAVLGVTMLIFFGDNDTLQRLPGFTNAATSPEFRLKLWHDTLDMAKAQPAGVGLDQFEDVFPQYRREALTFQAVRHPDSDWVWLLGETGWAGLAAGLLAVGALAAILLGKDARTSGPYRNLAALCVGLYLMNSLVNVPSHRFGTWLLAPWLLAIAAPDQEKPAKSLIPGFLWRLAGVALLVVGGGWLAAQVGGWPLNSTLIAERAKARADDAVVQKDGDALAAAAEDGVGVRPLAWWPYFNRARAELVYQNDPDAALNDFRIARFLEPVWAQVPYTEGLLWARANNHVQAVAAWREALNRQDDVPEGLWRNIWDELHTWPEDGEDYACILSRANPLFRSEFLTKQISAKRFPTELASDLQLDPELVRYSATQRRDILVRWAEIDGPGALAFLNSHPKIVDDSWEIAMRALAASGHKGDALNIARDHLPALDVPKLAIYGPTDEASLQQRFKEDNLNLEAGVALLRSQLDAKEYDGALATIQILAQQPNPPPFVSWIQADLLARAGKMDEAWDAFQPYLDYESKLTAKGK
jgi:O-antigen ligase